VKRLIVVPALMAALVSGCSFVSSDSPEATDVRATLNATAVTNDDTDLVYWFEYGTTTNYGTTTPDQTVDFADTEEDDIQTQPVSAELTGLEPGTTYHWRSCSSDQSPPPEPRKCYGRDGTFTTGPEQAHRYVVLGDSLTRIGDAHPYQDRVFATLDADGLADELQNVGVNGETSTTIQGAQLTSALDLINDPDSYTTVVTLDIGGNDILTNSDCLPSSPSFDLTACEPILQQFSTNLESILDALEGALADDPGPDRLAVMAYYNPWSGRGNATNDANGQDVLLGADHTIDCDGTGENLGLNDRIACKAAEHGLPVANVYPPFVGHGTIGDYFSDDVHPNGTGHQVVADTFEDALGL
jgi:lysophospholipase L1-like esterase